MNANASHIFTVQFSRRDGGYGASAGPEHLLRAPCKAKDNVDFCVSQEIKYILNTAPVHAELGVLVSVCVCEYLWPNNVRSFSSCFQ